MKVILIAAITADGFIGRGSTHSADWTGSADKQLFVRLTKEMGVMVMGRSTFDTIGRALPGRRTIVYTSHPKTLDVDGVETTSEEPAELIQRLKTEGAHGVAICGGTQIYTQFMQAGLVTDVYLTVIGTLFGTGLGIFNAELDTKLTLIETSQLDDQTVMLHYQVAA